MKKTVCFIVVLALLAISAGLVYAYRGGSGMGMGMGGGARGSGTGDTVFLETGFYVLLKTGNRMLLE